MSKPKRRPQRQMRPLVQLGLLAVSVTPVSTDAGDWFVPDYRIEGNDPLGLGAP